MTYLARFHKSPYTNRTPGGADNRCRVPFARATLDLRRPFATKRSMALRAGPARSTFLEGHRELGATRG
jgi:hypothetical protein